MIEPLKGWSGREVRLCATGYVASNDGKRGRVLERPEQAGAMRPAKPPAIRPKSECLIADVILKSSRIPTRGHINQYAT